MKLSRQEYEKGTLKSLKPRIDTYINIVPGTRAVEGLKVHLGQEFFPILTH